MVRHRRHSFVVGSGVWAEFAGAYKGLGSRLTLVSSLDRVLPGEDADAAKVIDDVLTRGGMEVMDESRMESVARAGIISGGGVVGPRASELIHVVSLAVSATLTVDQVARAFTVDPSMSGTAAELARRMHIQA